MGFYGELPVGTVMFGIWLYNIYDVMDSLSPLLRQEPSTFIGWGFFLVFNRVLMGFY